MLTVAGELAGDGVLLGAAVIGGDADVYTMLTRTHRDDLRQRALHGIGWEEAKSLFGGTRHAARIGEVAVHPYRDLRAVKSVLYLQMQAGILFSNGGVYRHENCGEQEETEHEATFHRKTRS